MFITRFTWSFSVLHLAYKSQISCTGVRSALMLFTSSTFFFIAIFIGFSSSEEEIDEFVLDELVDEDILSLQK